MGNIYEDDYFRARVDGDILRLERTAKSYPSMGTMHAANTALAAAILPSRVRRVLLDMRGAPGRNDEQFEHQTATWRQRLVTTADRVAVLVRSFAGKLQSQRLARDEGRVKQAFNVFLDEAEALEYLRRD
jgi:hypothetical protein